MVIMSRITYPVASDRSFTTEASTEITTEAGTEATNEAMNTNRISNYLGGGSIAALLLFLHIS